MRVRVLGILASFVVALAGCAEETLCAEFNDAQLRFAEKGARCIPPGSPTLEVDVARCEEELSACSGEDRSELQGLIDCYDALDTCDPEDASGFVEDQAKCLSKVDLGEDCQKAIAASLK